MIFVKDSYHKKREEIAERLKGIQYQHEELINHRDDVNRGISVLENEFHKIEGELRLLEDLANEEKILQDGAQRKSTEKK